MSLDGIQQLGADLWIGPQLQIDDFTAVAAKGFRSVINARPDREGPDQPDSARLEVAAKRAGLTYAYLPVIPNAISERDVAAFDKYLRDLPGPVLAFCRTGNRCGMLWSAVQARKAGQP
jgi:sulfide:quinone oxidoreductase